MSIGSSRRDFLKVVAAGTTAGLTACALAPRRALGGAAAQPLGAQVLTDNVVQITGLGTNAVLVTGSDGALLVDCGPAERSAELLRFVSKYPGAGKVSVLYNTHWHWDHTGGNERFAKAGATITAHENTKLWLGAEFLLELAGPAVPAAPERGLAHAALSTPRARPPSARTRWSTAICHGRTPTATSTFSFPGRTYWWPGAWCRSGATPSWITPPAGWIGGMADASKALLEVGDEKTLIVPGKGPVQRRADLQAQTDMLVDHVRPPEGPDAQGHRDR